MAYTTIDDPSAHFQIALYTGQGGTATAVTNDGNSDLQPDLIFFKSRSTTARWNIMDSTRGTTKVLYSEGTDAEATDAGDAKPLDSFNSDGFQAGESLDHHTNINTDSMVAFQWKANGGTRTTNTESGNNPGGGYQANTTGGVSIVDYTGTGAAGTMAHGLGTAPGVIIVKRRDDASSWIVYHRGNTSAPETDILELQANNATYDNSTYWNDTAPSSTVFTINTSSDGNADGATYIAYCFAEIQGFSKFGTYEGNGNADGAFVYTGFKPAWIITKRTNNATDAHWHIFDVKRNTHNPRNTRLEGNNNFADSTGEGGDFLSNGFKWRSTDVRYNGSDDTYVYMAFAENPFVSSKGIPATAR